MQTAQNTTENNNFSIKTKSFFGLFFVFTILSLSLYLAFSDNGNKTFKEGRHYSVVNEKEIINIPDNDFIKELPEYRKAFKDISMSFISTEAIASDEIEKTRTTEGEDGSRLVSSSFDLAGIDIVTEYKETDTLRSPTFNRKSDFF